MFELDSLREITSTIRKNKMRTVLTGFAVAWGIFMLIVLLAAGNGLKNGVMHNFSDRATNAMRVWPGRASMPYNGLPVNRRVRFDDRDIEMLKTRMPEVEHVSVGGGSTLNVSYGKEYASISLNCMTPGGAYINNITVKEGKGRFLNELDMKNKRKVIVLHPKHVSILFKDEDPLGKFVVAKNVVYQVVGVYDDKNVYDNDPSAYIPISAADIIYNPRRGYWMVEFTVKGINTVEDNNAFEERLRKKMGQLHSFDPKDRSALYIWSSTKQAIETQNMLSILSIFILLVGVASLMAGIVGVGNIMLITVRERTREIGIRKSLGATPSSILWLIIFEAIIITTCAGYIGIVLGVGVTELASSLLFSPDATGESSMFLNPTVELGTVLWATLFLIVCGVVAGIIPAFKATRVSPIEAMRAD